MVEVSESISEVRDLVDDVGVILMRRFLPDDDRDKRSDPTGFRERSERLLGCLSIEARKTRSSRATGKNAAFERMGAS